jgi:hypothetical protein
MESVSEGACCARTGVKRAILSRNERTVIRARLKVVINDASSKKDSLRIMGPPADRRQMGGGMK